MNTSIKNKKCRTLGSGHALDVSKWMLRQMFLGFLIAAGGLLTASDSCTLTQ
jgi:hypothetical protein